MTIANYNLEKKGINNAAQEQEGKSARPVLLRLFVSGTTQRSHNAIQNLRQICEEHLKGRYELQIIDVHQNQEMVRENQILAVPTLLKELPPPLRKIVGELSEKEKVLKGLDIQPKEHDTCANGSVCSN